MTATTSSRGTFPTRSAARSNAPPRAVRASLEVESHPGDGTIVRCLLPAGLV